ncbi:xanthine dehydrogenase accessory protein XdhC [Herbaspirillum robiniae]|uniref:Xanthine dehydrogenase accessory protein XdhC n=1 Tax=Herbaspirillum robiniae TaxID=2014887 RepID=A0A246WWA9_9BURK|nr:xanthine dehydrogenase accessory protein XdhC [Herbaspirillum robiniae]NUU01236.1 xanthine dehydrogenase accessory protein XdhC [Herbaspirillum robiniae]OWY31355.1 xanthine dehydrogenase accessory protein XdhC [Herbaspirillum robiniae]
MTTWLAALRELQNAAVPAVLVTVAEIQGSTPREAGARMVYTADKQYDTIGGGHLEWRAAQIARGMLEAAGKEPGQQQGQLPAQRRLERIALGPSLGQCCGGVVFLTFERIDQAAVQTWKELESHWRSGTDIWRALPLDNAEPVQLYETDGEACDLNGPDNGLHATLFRDVRKTYVTRDAYGRRWLLDLCRAHQPQVVLFGAGHVGAAIVKVLSNLPCRVLWVDEREDMFPEQLPPQITVEATDVPNAAVDMAEPGAYYLVMTHSHALDQQLTERILKRDAAHGDVGWFGLIGSYTKRKQFEHRLTDRGYTQEQLNRMTCPIGIPGIYGKEPASIAIAVVAQLMQLWELRFTQPARNKFPPALATHLLDGRG